VIASAVFLCVHSQNTQLPALCTPSPRTHSDDDLRLALVGPKLIKPSAAGEESKDVRPPRGRHFNSVYMCRRHRN